MTRLQGQPAPTDEELIRLLLRVLAGAVALVMALGVAAAAARMADPEPVAAPAPAGEASKTAGPPPGRLVGPYLQARTRELAGARGVRSAVVSFARYQDPPAARRSLTSAGVKIHSLLLAVPGGPLGEVAPATDSVNEFLRRQRAEALAEKRAIEELLPTVKDQDFIDQYTADLARVTSVARWLERPGPLVYGAVVSGPAEQLQSLARRSEVRLVDVAAAAKAPEPGTARALRPEETVTAGEPAGRPASAGTGGG